MKINFRDCVTVRISGSGCEKFFNCCLKNYIFLSDVKYDDFGAVCKISSKDFKRIRNCVRKSGVHLTIIKKSGVGLYIKRHRKRYGFFAGAVISFLLMIYLTSCIWVIDIKGNEYTNSEKILSSLKEHGMYTGCFRFGKNVKKLQNEVLLDVDTLSWLWVTLDGTRAVVEVREKGSFVEVKDKKIAYNIVASCDGYITDIIAKSGRKVIMRGETVNKGDLLISGISSTNFYGNRYIHSDGIVMAQTWRTKSGEYHHTKTTFLRSGKKVKKMSVNFFGFDVKLYMDNDSGFELYEMETAQKPVKIFGNIYLPVTFTIDTFYEIIKKDVIISDAEAVSSAVDRLSYEIEQERGNNARTAKREYKYTKLENGNVFVTVTIESNENIALPVKIDVEKTEEDHIGKDT